MSILATIKDHSGRIYRAIQALLLISIGAALLGTAEMSENLPSNSAYAVSILAGGSPCWR
ncbi:hypothetical protein [Mesorhizobium sp. B2-1-3A]|uniref:hypothetical protein n=1 Tax=Mesorhizobium sp. B2-1-3A TaxID=2589971 RepID=UPI001FEF33C8|nr:hypothetical protein [Mesorhizobium sp. B2-1-3A]